MFAVAIFGFLLYYNHSVVNHHLCIKKEKNMFNLKLMANALNLNKPAENAVKAETKAAAPAAAKEPAADSFEKAGAEAPKSPLQKVVDALKKLFA